MNDIGEHPILAIDHGRARIGLAVTDPLGMMAHPLTTLHVKEGKVLEQLTEIIEHKKIKQIVIGIPLLADGTEGSSAKYIKKFAKQVAHHFPALPLHFVDESYTTVMASEKLYETGKNAKQQKKIIDKAAAVEILNQWLQLKDPTFNDPEFYDEPDLI